MKFALGKKLNFSKPTLSLGEMSYHEKTVFVWKIISLSFFALVLVVFFTHLILLWPVTSSLEEAKGVGGANSAYLDHAAFENALSLIREKKENYEKGLETRLEVIDPSL